MEDYLKAVYKLQQAQNQVSTTSLAEELDRSAASVTNMVKGLAEQGLLEHTPYRGVRLTASGEVTALRIIRRHRVIELYLIEKLGYSWEDVHAEAERLEHAASDALIDRMAKTLGEPSIDPHGSPIPTRDGEIAETEWLSLDELEEGRAGV
ncbi:MAG: metal-dependent transcriptional regulator, partial [Gemmatimonadota bacterium]|nr:metal-dependent transcriptional regulator [Gemmatimonadota bacterium]